MGQIDDVAVSGGVAPADCEWDTAKAQATVESWLSAYDLDAIVCQNDGMAVGAGNAAGANSGIVITGLDGTPDGYEAIKDGRITGTVAQDGGAMAANGIGGLHKIWDGLIVGFLCLVVGKMLNLVAPLDCLG